MNCPNPPTSFNPANEPLWLVVQRDERTQCFEFPADTHKAIVVGSSNNADVRISSAAPVAFFLERQGTTIWLTPAYTDPDLRVDTIRVNGRREIYTHGLVELANVELRLKVRDTPPTLRGDGLIRLDSELSDPLSKREAAALNDLTATTTIDSSAVIAALRQGATTTVSTQKLFTEIADSTETVELDAFNFDGWFDEAIGEPLVASVDTQPIKPIQLPSTPASNLPANPTPDAVVAHVRRAGPLNVNTQKMVPLSPIHHTEPKLDPHRTVELAPLRLTGPERPSNTSLQKLEPLHQTTTIELRTPSIASDTTDFDVPVAKPTELKAVVPSPSIPLDSNANTSNRQVRHSTYVKPAGAINEQNSDRPVSSSSPSEVVRTLSSLSKALEKLGVQAKNRPVLVFGGAAIGSLVLVLFIVGATKVLTPHAKQTSGRATATHSTTTETIVHRESPESSVSEVAREKTDAAVGKTTSKPPPETKLENVPAAIAAAPDVTPAVGHLFAGRLPEAEQAYRDLAERFPNEPAFLSSVRILARKNSPTCRGATPSKTVCPSVKP